MKTTGHELFPSVSLDVWTHAKPQRRYPATFSFSEEKKLLSCKHMTPQRLLGISLLVFLALLVIGVGLYFIIIAQKRKKKTPPEQSTPPTLSLDAFNNTYAVFPVSPPLYFSRVANTVVPTSQCCGFQLNIEKRQTDGSLYNVRDMKTMDFLTILPIDLGFTSWYSIVLCPTLPKQGWTIQKQDNNQYTFSQQINGKMIFLGLAVDTRTILGIPKGEPSSGTSISLIKK